MIPGSNETGGGGAGAGAACLSCQTPTVGAWCHACGQKNDDMRRSAWSLVRDFVEDVFAFDSRMWRTLALMAARPGVVPTDYAHGRRSRYTPPVRLFLVVSFLFFLTLGLTDTMFVGLDIRQGPASAGAVASAGDGQTTVNCNLTAGLRFFVQPDELTMDADQWRRCRENIAQLAPEGRAAEDATPAFIEDIVRGLSSAIENPRAFNAGVNAWLPRVMFAMTPMLALILALFIRGRNALVFDHLVLSLYSHAVGFAVLGAAIALAQLGMRFAIPVAMAGFAVYFIVALRRGYGRGWVKTIWTAVAAGALYLLILVAIVLTIVANEVVSRG